MALQIGINGLGRIGKLVFRILSEDKRVKIVGLNDLMPIETLAHLVKYDSIHGIYPHNIASDGNRLLIDGCTVPYYRETSPENIPWKDLRADIVIESSGIFKTRSALETHLHAGASRVILSQPALDPVDRSVVIGVNEKTLRKSDIVISNASCTTNCLAPVLKILDETWGIESVFFNTVHPFTNNQSLLDGPHADLRRSRAAMVNIIPTTSTAVAALKQVMPELSSRVDGLATRVPVSAGSYIEIVANLSSNVSVERINGTFREASAGSYKGIIEYTDAPLVSSDILGNTHSAVFDSLLTRVLAGKTAQILVWYDNETGYANRLAELVHLL
jgi:glyceraldehyde 3-phosphate dehydrogenase